MNSAAAAPELAHGVLLVRAGRRDGCGRAPPGGRRGRGSLGSLGGAGGLCPGGLLRGDAGGLLGGDAAASSAARRAASSAASRSSSAWSAAACACGGGGLAGVPLAAAGHELLEGADGLRGVRRGRRVGGDAELRRDARRLEVGGVSGGVRARTGEHADQDGAGSGDPEVERPDRRPAVGGPVLGTGPAGPAGSGQCGGTTVHERQVLHNERARQVGGREAANCCRRTTGEAAGPGPEEEFTPVLRGPGSPSGDSAASGGDPWVGTLGRTWSHRIRRYRSVTMPGADPGP